MSDDIRYISSTVTDEEYEEIFGYCKKYGITRASLIRVSVFEYMDNNVGIDKKRGSISKLWRKVF